MASAIESAAREMIESIGKDPSPANRDAHIARLAKAVEDSKPEDGEEVYRDWARENLNKDGEVEIDPDAVVSISDDFGAYVAAWVWVSNADVGLPADEDEQKIADGECPKCGEDLGEDGECGDCGWPEDDEEGGG